MRHVGSTDRIAHGTELVDHLHPDPVPDGRGLGAFLAVTARQPGGPERLARTPPLVVTVVGWLLAVTFAWTASCRETSLNSSYQSERR